MVRRVSILGSTGSIGRQTLDVIAQHPDSFQLIALTANSNVDLMFAQCQQYRPKVVAMVSTIAAEQLQQRLRAAQLSIEVLAGSTSLESIASDTASDTVVAAIVGGAGLLSSLAAAKAGKRILLANKESLVMSGELFMTTTRHFGAEIIPVDSEHNAIFQCMPLGYRSGQNCPASIESIILTASGGPFRNTPLAQLAAVTPKQAIAHPNWSMGAKISVDCATMMNKGLEVIEAHWLFAVPPQRIEVLLHPQSTVHSFVRYRDGSLLAQLGEPDMRIPIACALMWPDRIRSGAKALDLSTLQHLEFQALDEQRYPCFALAKRALQQSGGAVCAMNAANEIAVDYFLNKKVAYLQIADVIDHVLNCFDDQPLLDIESVLAVDQQARRLAESYLKSGVHGISVV